MGETSVPNPPERDGNPHAADPHGTQPGAASVPIEEARDKVARVFRYLLEMHRIKTPPIVHSDQYEWSLDLGQVVHHPGIERGEVGTDDHGQGVVLEVGRPEESECPRPSVVFEKWLKSGWDDPAKEPTVHATRKLETGGSGTVEEAFADSEARVDAYEEWLDGWRVWASTERGVGDALQLFSELFELSGRFARESEKYQLYLTDGVLHADTANGPVRHPLLLSRVELEFDASTPKFILRETNDTPFLYAPLLRHLGCDGKELIALAEQLEEVRPHALERTRTTEFFKDLVQRFWEDGQFLEHPDLAVAATGPYLYRQPTILLGHRNHGFAESLERYIESLESLESTEEIPESLLRIVGVPSPDRAVDGASPAHDPLLTKEANPEQERVIQRLEETGAVLVQGPPGTGKSHTIANLVGHLLAQNKTILVTSHASKALRVVREKVAEPLQSLCVSLLESDEESSRQLEESITGIVNALSTTDPEQLGGEIAKISEKREALREEQNRLRTELLAAIAAEYEPLVGEGDTGVEQVDPAEVAKRLATSAKADGWIPAPIPLGTEPPLSPEEVGELYLLGSEVTAEDEQIAGASLPDPDRLPDPTAFASLYDDVARLETAAVKIGHEYWTRETGTVAEIHEAGARLAALLPTLSQESAWILGCLDAGRTGKEAREGWLALVAKIEECAERIPPLEESILAEGPKAPTDLAAAEAMALCDEIIDQLRAGEKLGGVTPENRPEWQEFIGQVSVDAGTPRTVAHLQALRNLFEVRALREELRVRWDRQLGPHEGPSSGSLGEKPEVRGAEQVERIRTSLAWHTDAWLPAEKALTDLGFDWQRFRRDHPSEPVAFAELRALRGWVEEVLPAILEHRAERRSLTERLAARDGWIEYLGGFAKPSKAKENVRSQGAAVAALVKLFLQGIKRKDFDAYSHAWRRLGEVIERTPAVERRQALLTKLENTAPALAAAIEAREAPHESGEPPGNFARAWRYRQWAQTLSTRHEVDFHGLQNQLAEVQTQLQETTANYVEKLAWAAQLERTGLAQQQALAGWLALHKKIGRGTGKGVARLREEAQKVLAECRSAVPVWIMPLSRVMESFDLATTRFDVVILDEASQNDVVGLVALALGKEAVVVGDHEQVSPYAVGYDVDRIQSLIDEILVDIPNQQLYDGRTSVYDLARQSFGGTIRLLEHFRCVPDIIQFSNFLCYGGEIRPLRERSASTLLPHVVAHTVESGVAKDKVNREEALEVASLIGAICQEPEYDGCSIGVISMVGTEQALHIDSILRARMSVAEVERRRLLCGNASQFQGDERDVMFLSLVDSPKDRPLTLRRRDEARKVFNVAASRARDQLWVVHSLDPARDLKAGDLRLQLIAHAADPGSSIEDALRQSGTGPAVSTFEQMLHDDLVAAGYRTTLHFPVGAMPIDLVVEGAQGQRVAILCEGGHEAPPDDLRERLERPMVLARLGWTIVRIRASAYFLDRKSSVRRLIRRLNGVGIEPVSAEVAGTDAGAAGEALRERITRSAAKIRRRWSETGGGDPLRRSRRSKGN